jgi:hypothetical protein
MGFELETLMHSEEFDPSPWIDGTPSEPHMPHGALPEAAIGVPKAGHRSLDARHLAAELSLASAQMRAKTSPRSHDSDQDTSTVPSRRP